MKRILSVIAVLLLLCGCRSPDNGNIENKDSYISGVWLSFSEINTMLISGDFASKFDEVAENCKNFGISDMFIHVRAFCDAVYPSDYFPMLSTAKGYNYDVFEYMINACHKREIRVHAWINPYRVRTADSNVSSLSANNPAYIWLNDDTSENDNNVCICNGIYLNPASSEVRQLIINGIREILTNYAVDGIHFDDYFYPTADESFDSADYSEYCSKSKTPLSLDDWRRANVNSLISGTYTAVKFMNKDTVFSVSPAASIEKNRTQYYADIAVWLESGCVDYIIPQLYFGFEYPDKNYNFDKLLDEWCELSKDSNAKLLIGLASYKVGTKQQPDCDEWGSKDDILSRQVKLCREKQNVLGHIFFSYTSLFSNDDLNVKSRNNIK